VRASSGGCEKEEGKERKKRDIRKKNMEGKVER
jgi:hypothetical protein